MTAGRRGRGADRLALAALGLLLAGSVASRVRPDGGDTPAPKPRQATVDLGGGVVLPRGALTARDVLVGACWTPIPVEIVEPSPHGADASLVGPRNDGDRVVYAYHGRLLGGRFAATQLTVLHVLRRGIAVLNLDGAGGRDTLAVKLTMPAGCAAEPEEALAALRREAQAGR